MGCSPSGMINKSTTKVREPSVKEVLDDSNSTARHFEAFSTARDHPWTVWRDLYSRQASMPGAHEALGQFRDMFATLSDLSARQATANATLSAAFQSKIESLQSVLQRIRVVEALKVSEHQCVEAEQNAKKRLNRAKQKLAELETKPGKEAAIDKQQATVGDAEAALAAASSARVDATTHRTTEEAKLTGDNARSVHAALLAENMALQEYFNTALHITTSEGEAMRAMQLPEGPLLDTPTLAPSTA